MTKHECAVIMAFTGVAMLKGNYLDLFYDYVSKILGRPVYTHEMAMLSEEIKEAARNDFVQLCRNASDEDKPLTNGDKIRAMPELIDKKRTEAKVFLIARHFIDRPDREVELVKAVIHRCCEEIDNQPTIEPEVRRGRWIVKGQDIYCSECNEESLYNPFGASKFSRFCPNCGATMDGGADNG